MRHHNQVLLLIVLSALLAILCLDVGRLALAPTRDASVDAVRIRNAMLAELGNPRDTAWPPSAMPANFRSEALPAPAFFTEIIDQIIPTHARQEPALARALRIARHLALTSRAGDPIQASARVAYEKIVGGQGGYCADYGQVFNALALAAGLAVREWGFTWEDMANGHAFNEIWEPNLSKWILIDAFNSFYVVDAGNGVPMGALEFRASLLGEPGAGRAHVVPILSNRVGFKSSEKALDYYRRGLPRMYLLLGDNVFSQDANPLVRATESLPRSVQVLAAILLGERPRYLFVPTSSQPQVAEQVERLHWLLLWVLAKITVTALLGAALSIAAWRLVWVKRHQASGATGSPNLTKHGH